MWDCPSLQVYKPLYFSIVLHSIPYPQSIPLVILTHMTPHHHWLRNYTPYRIPIRLADHSIVYSAGVGSVVFTPEVKGKTLHSVEFTRVLHVPHLKNNLLSVLYLARVHKFHIHIHDTSMDFLRSGQLLFLLDLE